MITPDYLCDSVAMVSGSFRKVCMISGLSRKDTRDQPVAALVVVEEKGRQADRRIRQRIHGRTRAYANLSYSVVCLLA